MARQGEETGLGWLPHSRRWLLVAPALLLLWIVGQIDKTNISLIIADEAFLRELNLAGRNTELGGLMGAFLAGYGIAIFLWGFLVDRFGPRVCAMTGILCWGGFLFLSSRATSIEELLALRFFLGVAEGNLWPVSNALTNRWFPAHEHSRAQAFWLTGSTLGTAVGVPIVTQLLLASGWRGTLGYLALLSLLPIALLFFVRNRPREQKGISLRELQAIESDPKKAVSVTPMSLSELLRHTPFWLIAVCQLASCTTIFTLVQWTPRFLTSYRQESFRSMSGWITLGYVLATILTLAVGYLADRTMQRSLAGMWVSFLFALTVLPGAFLLPPAGSALLLSTLIAVAAVTAAVNGALLHQMVRPEAIARGTGIYVGLGNGLAGVGPAAFGYFITLLGGQYWGGFLYLALLNVVGAVCYLALHRISSRALAAAPVAAPSRKVLTTES